MSYKTFNPQRRSKGIYVINNDVEAALRVLKNAVAPLMKELKMKRYFETNTAKRRRKMKAAVIKERQRQRFFANNF